MTKRKEIYLALGERDGWDCHYCAIALVPVGQESTVCEWDERRVFWNHCGCGKHEFCGGPLPMPCVYEGSWRLPKGYAWPQIDHVIPRAKDGPDSLENYVLACSPCNRRKSTDDYAPFYAGLAEVRRARYADRAMENA